MFLRRHELKNAPEGESQRDHGGGINYNLLAGVNTSSTEAASKQVGRLKKKKVQT
jgi:hypothetical protein